MSSDGGSAVPLIGGTLGAGGALMEGSDKAQAYRDEADQLTSNAMKERKVGEFNAMRQNIMAQKKFGSMDSNYAASGVTSDSVSALNVLADSHANAELDRLSILHGAELRAHTMEQRAAYDRSASNRSTQMGYFNAFSSLFGGAAKAGLNSSSRGSSGGDLDFSDFEESDYGSAGDGGKGSFYA